MSTGYKTLLAEGTSEVVEKKSRFLGLAVHVESEEEAMTLLERIRKKHYDARHHCWAYVLGEDGKNERASDDGEPSGTAGRPILETIRHAHLTYTFVVVTRYFGGTLLGTGGLVRAYTQSSEQALFSAKTANYSPADFLYVTSDYADIGKLQNFYAQEGITLLSSDYAEKVLVTLLCAEEQTEGIKKQITELTAGRAVVDTKKAGYQML